MLVSVQSSLTFIRNEIYMLNLTAYQVYLESVILGVLSFGVILFI